MELLDIGLREALIGIACLLFTRKILHILLARNQARHNNNRIIVQVQRPTPPAILSPPTPPITSPITPLTTLTPTPAPVPLIKRHGEDEDYETASDDGSDNDENVDPYRDFKKRLRYRSILENITK